MIAIAYAMTAVDGVMQATFSVQGSLAGPILGTFLLGMMVPHCTKKGAFVGTIFAIVSI